MTEADPFEDAPLYGTGDLARFLGGSRDSFTGLLLVLFQKADPGNLARLKRGFPEVHAAWAMWSAMSPVPTPRQLREALERVGQPERAASS
jgi:hypothetical protein